MDGRVGAIRAELDAEGFTDTADPRLLREVRLGLLRAVPRGGRLDARVRRPPRLPDGPRQRARGAARGAARHRRGRGHRDGQAGARLRRPDRARSSEATACRWRRTTSAASTRWSRPPPPPGTLEERATRARDPHLAPPRGRGHHHHLPRKGRRPMAEPSEPNDRARSPKLRSRADGAAVALDDLDRKLLNLMQGSFPIAAAPLRARSPRAAGITEERGAGARRASCSSSASSARSRRSTTRARSATPRCSSPPRSIPSTRGGRRRSSTRIPGVSHNYLRNHEFNMWFTIATEPDSRARPGGHARGARGS